MPFSLLTCLRTGDKKLAVGHLPAVEILGNEKEIGRAAMLPVPYAASSRRHLLSISWKVDTASCQRPLRLAHRSAFACSSLHVAQFTIEVVG